MVKAKLLYQCNACAAQTTKWSGQCNDCGAWNTLTEIQKISMPYRGRSQAVNDVNVQATVKRLKDITINSECRYDSGLSELNRVLGGGIVQGSVVMLGGDPGIGKSTLLLQALATMSKTLSVLYVTGEESLEQVGMRAQRLNVDTENLQLLTETHVETVLGLLSKIKPQVVVIDSIQTVFTETIQSAPGSVSQLRESTALLVNYAKNNGTAIILVGHVTKEGYLAGPRVLEHMVDTVLYFEGDGSNRYRFIRAMKNRFGSVNEVGVFAMTDRGLKVVANPSAIFLSRYEQTTPGSIILVTREGTRPLLVEVQALVHESYSGNPRRVALGHDLNRLTMLLAVLHRHANIATFNHDVYVNIVGGIRVTETGADLSVLLSVITSLRDKPLSGRTVVFGEIGLAGEIRPVQNGQERLAESAQHGFNRAIIPIPNAPKQSISGLQINAVKHISDVLKIL